MTPTPQPPTPQPPTPQPSTPQPSTPQPSTPQAACPQPSTPQAACPQAACPAGCGGPPLTICATHAQDLTHTLELISYHLIEGRVPLALREDFFYHLAMLQLRQETRPVTTVTTVSTVTTVTTVTINNTKDLRS